MNKKNLINFISSCLIALIGVVTLILPLLSVTDIRVVFIIIITFYGIINIMRNIALLESKEYSGFSTALSCMIILILLFFIDVNNSPWNLALLLFIWVILMSLTKLKETDYYHDRKNKLWLFNLVSLIIFIISGILTTLNLYYPAEIQLLVIGFFILICGILEIMKPIAAHILDSCNVEAHKKK